MITTSTCCASQGHQKPFQFGTQSVVAERFFLLQARIKYSKDHSQCQFGALFKIGRCREDYQGFARMSSGNRLETALYSVSTYLLSPNFIISLGWKCLHSPSSHLPCGYDTKERSKRTFQEKFRRNIFSDFTLCRFTQRTA